MKISLPTYLKDDLVAMASERKISIQDMILQILSTAMLVEKYITPEENEQIMTIYRKYLQ